MKRENRDNLSIRELSFIKDYIIYPEGSVLVSFGNTKVMCNATVEERVPRFKENSGEGWLTAEYSMLPRATHSRVRRDISSLRQNGRSVEIQRLIGRALRQAIDLKALGERTITIDCDVIQADGGTRTASITGGFVALYIAMEKLVQEGVIGKNPIVKFVSAVSVGIVDGEVLLDLCYEEDSNAEVDMNIIMADNEFVEVQGTGENNTFSYDQLTKLLEAGKKGCEDITKAQKEILNI